MLPIHLISGPRNLSTTLMYSFDSRCDTLAYDEPLYAHYLKYTGLDHPGREEVLRKMSSDATSIIDSLFLKPSAHADKPYVFIKNMAHHLKGIHIDWLLDLPTILLIRDPERIVRSFSQVMPDMTIDDIGIELQYEIWQQFLNAQKPIAILDSANILENPSSVMKQLCDFLGIPFTEKMLSWKAGPRTIDGCWANYWYANVHRSTGIGQVKKMPQKNTGQELKPHLKAIVDQAMPLYHKMAAHAIQAK